LETIESCSFPNPRLSDTLGMDPRPTLEGGSSVLIVEDDEDIRYLLAESLATSGFKVTEAGDGVEAFAALEDGLEPDVIVLDLMMPRMNGWAFLEKLRTQAEHRDIPVLVTSAFSDLRSAKANAYLAKPFRMDEFDEAVARLCGLQ